VGVGVGEDVAVGVCVDVGVDVGAGVEEAVSVGVFDGRGDGVAVGGRVAKATVVPVGSGGNVDTLSGVWPLLQATIKNTPNVNANNRFTTQKS